MSGSLSRIATGDSENCGVLAPLGGGRTTAQSRCGGVVVRIFVWFRWFERTQLKMAMQQQDPRRVSDVALICDRSFDVCCAGQTVHRMSCICLGCDAHCLGRVKSCQVMSGCGTRKKRSRLTVRLKSQPGSWKAVCARRRRQVPQTAIVFLSRKTRAGACQVARRILLCR